jgi:hypothetical protein
MILPRRDATGSNTPWSVAKGTGLNARFIELSDSVLGVAGTRDRKWEKRPVVPIPRLALWSAAKFTPFA